MVTILLTFLFYLWISECVQSKKIYAVIQQNVVLLFINKKYNQMKALKMLMFKRIKLLNTILRCYI